METPNLAYIIKLKRKLSHIIIQNNYNLLSPEVIRLSKELDQLMLPLFIKQIEELE